MIDYVSGESVLPMLGQLTFRGNCALLCLVNEICFFVLLSGKSYCVYYQNEDGFFVFCNVFSTLKKCYDFINSFGGLL